MRPSYRTAEDTRTDNDRVSRDVLSVLHARKHWLEGELARLRDQENAMVAQLLLIDGQIATVIDCQV